MKDTQDLYELALHLEKLKGKETQFSLGFSGRLIQTRKRIDEPWVRGFTYALVLFVAGIISAYTTVWNNWNFAQILPFWLVAAGYIGILIIEEKRMHKSHNKDRIMLINLENCPICQYIFDADGRLHFQQYTEIICPICHSKFGKKGAKKKK